MSPLLLLLAAGLAKQDAPAAAQKPAETKQSAPPTEEPPEEDESLKPKEYAFNPVQATHEIRTGDFYMKKSKYKAAAARFREATRWNPQNAEAFRKLGEAEEKQDDIKEARDAYQKSLEIEPDSKPAAEVKKRLKKLAAS